MSSIIINGETAEVRDNQTELKEPAPTIFYPEDSPCGRSLAEVSLDQPSETT